MHTIQLFLSVNDWSAPLGRHWRNSPLVFSFNIHFYWLCDRRNKLPRRFVQCVVHISSSHTLSRRWRFYAIQGELHWTLYSETIQSWLHQPPEIWVNTASSAWYAQPMYPLKNDSLCFESYRPANALESDDPPLPADANKYFSFRHDVLKSAQSKDLGAMFVTATAKQAIHSRRSSLRDIAYTASLCQSVAD